MNQEVFTPNQAAKICKTSFMSVHRWIDAGKLKSYKTPGGHNRIVKDDLIDFMKENNIPFIDDIVRKRYKVMIIDDDPEICELLSKELRSTRYNIDVSVACNGFEAGSLITRIVPDVILLDLMMPGIDGFDVCKLIKGNPDTKHIKVVIITGYGNDENVEKAMAAGAERVLFKPVNLGIILQEILVY